METPVELIPLNCIRCGTPIQADIDEVAWACKQCGQGQQLGEDGLIALQIHYSRGITPPKMGHPFWVSEGRVDIARDTYGFSGEKTNDALRFWEQPRQFIIPAFPYSLDEFSRVGVQWLQVPPTLQPGPAADFDPVTVASNDVNAWAEFLVMGLEAKRKDKIKKIEFKLTLSKLQLWILP